MDIICQKGVYGRCDDFDGMGYVFYACIQKSHYFYSGGMDLTQKIECAAEKASTMQKFVFHT